MKSAPTNSEQRLANLLPSLRNVTESMRKRNDALESHLIETGWLKRQREASKPAAQSTQPPR